MEKMLTAPCPICGNLHSISISCITLLKHLSSSSEALLTPKNTSLIGQQFGSFRAIKLIGEGGMGAVYLGEHTLIGSKVAIKILHQHLAVNPLLVQRFYAEAKAVNLIGHANIVNIFDMNVVPPSLYYLIMEYLEGYSLNHLLNNPMECITALGILEQVCDALDAAHAHGVVHRDLKPENIFITKVGRNERFVKILDFGIAKLFSKDTSHKTDAGIIIGTPEYMAPEQTSGLPVDGKSDIYSLGVVAYAMSTARLPFGGGLTDLLLAHRERPPTPPNKLNSKLPTAWSNAILKALNKNPQERYETAAAFAEALSHSLLLPAKLLPKTPPVPTHNPPPSAPPLPELEIWDETQKTWSHLKLIEWNKNGCFIQDTKLPPLFSRLRLRVAGQLVLDAEVIQHVRAEQSKQWNLPEGYGLQFAPAHASLKQTLAAIQQGEYSRSPPVNASKNTQVEEKLNALKKRLELTNPYEQLELLENAEFSNIRARIREIQKTLQTLEAQNISNQQRQTLQQLKDKLQQTLATIGSPLPRAAFDAQQKNFRGVARSITAGLKASEVEQLRKSYLSSNPRAEGIAYFKMLMADAASKKGNIPRAIQLMEEALFQDPLNLGFHQRYWTLRKKLQESRP